jgi:hypothetical protein
MDHHIAQVNIAQAKDSMESETMADFVARLDEINALAESAPGFVWRLKTEDGNATSLRPFDDEFIIVNMTVWETIEALYQYVYYSDHVEVYRRRREWFNVLKNPAFVMWWIPAEHIPTIDEAKQKLEHLQEYGPTPLAFTFKQPFVVADMLSYQQS